MLLKTSKTPKFTEADLVASITRESFYEFLKEFWDVIIPETPVWNWHIKYLCDEFQKIAERVIAGKPKAYDLIVNISPGTTKSTICSVAFPAWVWTRMPSCRFICGSHAQDLGLDLSRKCRKIIEEKVRIDGKPTYYDCFKLGLTGDQNTKSYFVNEKGGMRLSCTVGGKSPIGFHGHILVIDDPLDPQSAVSDVELKSANEWMNNTLPSRKVDKLMSVTALVMQRLHQNDPSGNWLGKKRDDVKHIKLPAECMTYQVHPPFLKKYYKNDMMDPVRMPKSFLDAELMKHGQYYVAGQYGQNPVPLGGGMFKIKNLRIGEAPKTFKRIVRFWDKAGTVGGRGAFTVGVKMGVDFDDRFWVLDVIRGRWDSSEREKIILATARTDGRGVVVGIEQEPGSGGKDSAAATVRMLQGFRVIIDKPTGSDGSKELRADPFASQVNGHNVSLQAAKWNTDYIEELEYFPASTYKDQVDASSGAFNHLAQARRKAGAM